MSTSGIFHRAAVLKGWAGVTALILSALVSVPSSAQSGPSTQPARDPGKPTLWIVGDSTVRNGSNTLKGWGEVITPLFDTTKINIENRAIGGRSSRTFQTEGRWDKVLEECKPGDFVLLQMGHNDASVLNEEVLDSKTRARGTIRGVGEETQEVENILTKKREVVHTYGWYMRKYVNDAKEKGMATIICSPIPRLPKETPKEADFSKPAAERGSYVGWSAEAAKSTGAGFIDLNQLVLAEYAKMTAEDVKTKYFTANDATHTNEEGAMLNAKCVAKGLRGSDSELRNYLRAE